MSNMRHASKYHRLVKAQNGSPAYKKLKFQLRYAAKRLKKPRYDHDTYLSERVRIENGKPDSNDESWSSQ